MKSTVFGHKALISTFVGIALSIGGISFAMASAGHGSVKEISIGQPGEAAHVSRTIDVNLEDNFFTPETIEVSKNQTVRFVIKNTGEFVHEFNIGTAAMHASHQKEMMMMVDHGMLEVDKVNRDMKMDMGEGGMMSHDDPNSVLLEPGETAEIIWQFPEAAELEFACNVPGHYDSGMMGEITVGEPDHDNVELSTH
ncbi:cupredoxin domain-containing protein [Kiloniella antarctica]|uniref:Cupredoxin domain-containing protein n=1 Tax=Kiloniella antarctica TaxID=1550907 RepID=A0ABW5BII0_9PROT